MQRRATASTHLTLYTTSEQRNDDPDASVSITSEGKRTIVPDLVEIFAISEDGSLIFLSHGTDKSKLSFGLWDMHLNRFKYKLTTFENNNPTQVRCCIFSPDNSYLAITYQPKSDVPMQVDVWDLTQHIPTSKIIKEGLDRPYLSFSHNAQKLIISEIDFGMTVWEICTGKLIFKVYDEKFEFWSARFSFDDRYIGLRRGDKSLRIYDSNTGILFRSITDCRNPYIGFVFTEDAGKVVYFSDYHELMVYDFINQLNVGIIPLEGRTPGQLAHSFNRQYLLVSCYEPQARNERWLIKVVNLNKMTCIATHQLDKMISIVAVSDQGKIHVCKTDDNENLELEVLSCDALKQVEKPCASP